MRFHPLISIFLGAVAIIVLFLILVGIQGVPNFNNKVIVAIFFITAMLILLVGGFIATYFAMNIKIRYGIYLGLILASMETIGNNNLVRYNGIGIAIFVIIIFSLVSGIGGFIAKMTEKNNRQLFKSKHMTNGFSPIIAVAVGFIVATVCVDLLELILGINHSSTTYGVINFIVESISLLIGGFVTLFLVKEKKIQYGIYVAIIVIIIIIILKSYVDIVQSIVIHESYVVFLGSFVGYLLFAGLGGYLGIIVAKHFNKKNLN
jgi:hypothetical protein